MVVRFNISVRPFFNFFLDVIFPPLCGGCQKLGTLLCTNCYERLCFYPLEINISRLELTACYLDKIQAAVEYNESAKSVIATIKYRGVIDVAKVCGGVLYDTMDLPPIDCIVPVPLHRQREKDRGFNQAAVMAGALSQASNTPWFPLLERVKATTPQAGIADKQERLHRLENCFQISQKAAQRPALPPRVLLLDDVVTTGSTLNECARVLKQAGVKNVYGLAFAHGV